MEYHRCVRSFISLSLSRLIENRPRTCFHPAKERDWNSLPDEALAYTWMFPRKAGNYTLVCVPLGLRNGGKVEVVEEKVVSEPLPAKCYFELGRGGRRTRILLRRKETRVKMEGDEDGLCDGAVYKRVPPTLSFLEIVWNTLVSYFAR